MTMNRSRTAAFTEFAGDVSSGSYPQPSHVLSVDDAEYSAFLSGLEA